MRRPTTYRPRQIRQIHFCLFSVLLVLFAGSARAQQCQPNMLSITGQDSYVATPDAPALHLTSGFTIECWAKLSNLNRLGGILDKGPGVLSIYGLFIDTAQRIVARAFAHSGYRITATTPGSLTDWHHYAFVFAPGDSFYVYIDGAEAASQKVAALSLDSSKDSLRIGISSAGSSFVGNIDELRIWRMARSRTAILSTMNTSLSGDETGLALYYPFDDETGAHRIHDFSGNGNDGFIQGSFAEVVPSSSPITQPTRGFRLNALQTTLNIPTRRCSPSFDTIIRLRNMGSQPLIVNSVGFYRGVAFSVTSDLPFELPPDTTHYFNLRIHYSPSTGGVYDDTLYISSTDDCAGTLRIGLHAVYDSVGIQSSPSSIDFGALSECQLPATRTVLVTNRSSTDSVSIVGAALPAGISVVTALPLRLAAKETKPVVLSLNPGARGLVSGQVLFPLDKCSRQAIVSVQADRELAELAIPDTMDLGTYPGELQPRVLDTFLIVRNDGDLGSTLTSISTSDTSLRVLEPRQKSYLSIGDTLQLRLRMSATGCGTVTKSLRIRSYPCGVDTTTVLRVTFVPAAPLTAPSLDLGRVCELADTSIRISNPNATELRLDTVTFSRNAVFFTPYGSFPVIIAPHSSVSLPIRFAPGTAGAYDVTANLVASPCTIGTLDLRGAKGAPGFAFDQPSVSLARGCDTTSITRWATLRNGSSSPVTIVDTVSTGLSGRVTLDAFPLPFTLNPGDVRVFTIHYDPAIGSKDSGRLSFVSQEGCLLANLTMEGSREFAQAAWSDTTLNFDTVCSSAPGEKTVYLYNSGFDTLDVLTATVTGSGFSLVSHATAIAPGANGAFTLLFTPQAEQDYTSALRVVVNTCGTSFTLPLSGSGGPSPSIVFDVPALDLGRVRVGDSATACIRLRNPSCEALAIDASTFAALSHPFHLSAASLRQLPFALSRDSDLTLCFVFKPLSYGDASTQYPVTIGSSTYATLSLHGVGLGPDVRLAEHTLDFGNVLHGSSKTLPLHLTNVGNDTAWLTEQIGGAAEYTSSSISVLAPGASTTLDVQFAPGSSSGLRSAVLVVAWDGHQDTVTLRGAGADRGLQLSALGLDFGDRHLNSDSVATIALTSLLDQPVVRSVAITGAPQSVLSWTTDKALPYSFTGGTDTLRVFVRYSALREQQESATLLVTDDTHTISLSITGRGIEAHAKVNGNVDFGEVEIGHSLTLQPVQLADTGLYPMRVLQLIHSPVFQVGPDDPSLEITNVSPRLYTVTFSPTRAKRYVDTLRFVTTSPDPTPFVLLTGTGVYPPQDRPQIEYRVASTVVKAGDHVSIPVSISGTNLDHIDVDSITLDLRFDPTMVRITSATGTSMTIGTPRLVAKRDSVVEVSFAPRTLTDGILVTLEGEALLGSVETTYVHVTSAAPSPTTVAASDEGLFVVTDCGGALHGVTLRGAYSTQAVAPNPVSATALLRYTLGLPGPVTVDLYDPIGQLVRSYRSELEEKGEHTRAIDASTLPNGRYYYRLRSLEYVSEGSITVVH